MISTLDRRLSTRAVLALVICALTVGLLAQHARADIPPARGAMILSPDTGPAGTQVTARGQLLSPTPLDGAWSEPVAVYFGGQLVARTATDDLGRFTARFQVPPSPVVLGARAVTVSAVGRASHRSVSATFYMP